MVIQDETNIQESSINQAITQCQLCFVQALLEQFHLILQVCIYLLSVFQSHSHSKILSLISVTLSHINEFYEWLCVKPGMQERGTECGVREEWGECYIPGNVAKHSEECHQTFRGMPSNIPENVTKHCGNVLKHSGECHQTDEFLSRSRHFYKTSNFFRGVFTTPSNI